MKSPKVLCFLLVALCIGLLFCGCEEIPDPEYQRGEIVMRVTGGEPVQIVDHTWFRNERTYWVRLPNGEKQVFYSFELTKLPSQ